MTAQYCIQQLPKLASRPLTSVEYSGTRKALVSSLLDYIDLTWSNDASVVPATAATVLGEVSRCYADVGAYQDTRVAYGVMRDLIKKAIVENRIHISLAATDAAVATLPSLMRVQVKNIRDSLLANYFELLDVLAELRPGVLIKFQDPSALIFPGIAVSGTGLQSVLWQSELDARAAMSLADAFLPWLKDRIEGFAKLQNDPNLSCLADGLALLLCVALRLTLSQGPAGWPQRCVDAAVSWINSADVVGAREKLLHPNIAELIWSCLLAASHAANDPDVLTVASSELRETVIQTQAVEVGEYEGSFIRGLFLASGRTLDEANLYIHAGQLRSHGPQYDGIYIEGFGNAPTINQNRTAHPVGLPGLINTWVLEKFPQFARTAL